MRKRTILLIISIVLLLGITTSCNTIGSKTNTSNDESSPNSTGNQQPSPLNGEEEMSIQIQLVFGTFKLEETDLAVTPEQAEELLPLWKAANSLSDSDNVSTVELEAVFKQIEETMTAEQMEAIEAMEFSFDEMRSLMEDAGIEIGLGRGGFGEITPEMQATMEAARESGEFNFREGFQPGMGGGPEGGGMPPGGMIGGGPGGGGGFGEGFGPGMMNENGDSDSDTANRFARQAFTIYYQAIIELLEDKIQ
jgi:hypothetical protein